MTSNLGIPQELTDDTRDTIAELRGYYSDRAAINDRISAAKNKLKSKGIHKKALDHAMWYEGLEEEARAGYDLSLHVCREAAGVPLASQADLFADMEAERKQKAKAFKEEEAKLERDAMFANTAEKRDQQREEENKKREADAAKAEERRAEMRKKLDLDEQAEGEAVFKTQKAALKLTPEQIAARNPVGFSVQ